MIEQNYLLESEYDPSELYITTYSGIKFYPYKLNTSMISISDIAHSLSNICRFNGHTKKFYSVAEHSVRVCEYIDKPRYKLLGLLHDAAEAYICDLVKPIKVSPGFEEFNNLEGKFLSVIGKRFGFTLDPSGLLPDCVKEADYVLLRVEMRDLMENGCYKTQEFPQMKTISSITEPMSPYQAEEAFMDMFYKYCTKNGNFYKP